VFWISLQLLSETFLILWDIERDMIKNVHWSSCKVQGDQNVTVRWKTQCIRTIPTQFMFWRWPSLIKFGTRAVLYWTRSSSTQFGESINFWKLAADNLNITHYFLHCNHQVHREFLIILYLYNFQILIKFEFSRHVLNNTHIISNKNPFSGSRILPCGRSDRQTDMTKPTLASRNFENAPKILTHYQVLVVNNYLFINLFG
jgi:hypothetical protein